MKLPPVQPTTVPYVAGEPSQPLPLHVAIEMIAEQCADCGAAVKVHRRSIKGAREALGAKGIALRVICHACAAPLESSINPLNKAIVLPPNWRRDQRQGDLQ